MHWGHSVLRKKGDGAMTRKQRVNTSLSYPQVSESQIIANDDPQNKLPHAATQKIQWEVRTLP